MSMRAERIEASNQASQLRIKPGENIVEFYQRLDQERAAKDSAFALRQKIEKARAGFTDTTGEDGE